MSLRASAKSSLLWSSVDTLGVKAISFVVSIKLARILSPTDFGLVGLIVIFVSMGSILVDSGMGSSLIRDNEATDIDFDTVFYTNLGVSLILYILLFIGAPFIGAFYEKLILVDLIRVYGLSFIFSAFFVTQQSKMIKELQFKKIAMLTMPSTLISGLIAIAMAKLGYGVWSIIGLYLSSQLLKSILIWYQSEWKPSLQFSKERLAYHFNYGYKLVLSGMLGVFTRELYSLVIGKKFDISSVGYYSRANSLKAYPVSIFGSIISKVTFPLLTKIKDDKEKISLIYQRILKVSFFVMTAVMTTLIVIAEPLILFLYTEKWSAAIPYFQIVALAGILVPIHSFNLNIFRIYGRTDVLLKLSIIKNVLVFFAVGVGVYFGIIGLLWASVGVSVISLLINTSSSEEMINYKTMKQLRDMGPIIGIGFVSYLLSMQAMLIIDTEYNLAGIFLGAFIFISTFLGINFLFNTDSLKETIRMGRLLTLDKA